MHRFHKPRFSIVVVFALFYINSSFASPVVNAKRSMVSLVAAYEPVKAIPTDEVPSHHPIPSGGNSTRNDRVNEVVPLSEPVNVVPVDAFPPGQLITGGSSSTTNDGTTLTTTYNIPRHRVRRRKVNEVSSVSEPVNVVPVDAFPPGQLITGGSSSTTNDGTTLTTTYNIPRHRVRRRKVNEVSSVSEPVNVVPVDAFPPGQLITGGSSSTTNDGTTVITTFTPGHVMPNPANATKGTNYLSLINTNLTQPALDMGLNCEGSKLMCLGATQMGVMHTLRDYMYAIPRGYHYYAGQKIACMKHNVYPNPWMTWGFYCAFMQGNIPAEGVDGAEIELKMQQMIEHSCLGCGSVPFSPDNDPRPLGILTVNYVRKSECEGLCYYAPPGAAANAVKVPQGMTLVADSQGLKSS